MPVIAIALLAVGCGSTQEAVIEPNVGPKTTDGIHDGADQNDDVDPKAAAFNDGEVAPPPGVRPFPASRFVSYLGFAHGSTKSELAELMPAKLPTLGKRTELDIQGSHGYKYEGHFVVSWQSGTGLIDYVSVKSEHAIRYLRDHRRTDDKLQALWNIAPGQAIALLGKPTDRVDRPHAHTLRYDFEADGGRKGALSLEFTKLTSPPRCTAVSVHWMH